MAPKKEIESLASSLINNPKAKTDYRNANPASTNINNYIFSVELVRDNIRCAKNNQCIWFSTDVEGRKVDNLQKFVFCISCNRIYHVKCAETDFKTISVEQLPWICHICTTNPLNVEAQMLVNENKHKEPFDVRVKHFLKETEEIAESSESGEEELDETVHLDANMRQIPAEYLKQIQKMSKKCQKLMAQNKQLEESLKQYKGESSKDIIQSTNGNGVEDQTKMVTQSINVHKRNANDFSNVSYTNAILGANAASTGIDAVLQNPSMLGNQVLPISNLSETVPVDSSLNKSEAAIQHINALTLNEIRKSLPKIEIFDGKPEKWLTFQRAVERNWKEGRYSDDMMKLHIRQALSGQALARVDGLIDMMTARQVLQFLKESFGNSNVIVEQSRQKLMTVKISKPLTHSSCVELTTLMANYIAACTYAGLLVADSSISSRIHSQLEAFHQQMYYEFYFKKYPDATTRVERLDVQFEFLNTISRTLPLGYFKTEENKVKSKSQYQVMVTSIDGSSKFSNNARIKRNSATNDDAYKYEIKDKEIAKYIGYDMNKLSKIQKKCEFCQRTNHYSIECRNYRDMTIDEKYSTAKAKGLCMCCLITTSHSPKDCDLKVGCGFKVDKNTRCTAKHHVTLHRRDRNNSNKFNGNNRYKKQQRRSRSNQNNDQAREKLKSHQSQSNSKDNSQVLQHQVGTSNNLGPSTPTNSHVQQNESSSAVGVVTVDQNKPYQSLTVSNLNCINQSSHRTVKLFRTYFYGKSKAIGFALGDSGSEITLVRKDLIEDLGITGQKCMLNLQWTDAIIKNSVALKVKLRISGIGRSDEVLELDECYAIDDLSLAARSLNVEELKRKFPYLEDVPFESYKNAIPSVLIGSRHAFMVEAIEPLIHGGNSKPIGIRTKLGYTIYGGAPECFQESHSVNSHQVEHQEQAAATENEKLSEIYSYACSIDSLGIKPKDSHMTRDEKLAMEIAEKEMRVLSNGSVELPLIWNKTDGTIPKLPDNYSMVYKRQLGQEKKLMKSPELMEAYNNNFMQLIKDNYVRLATDKDLQTDWPNIWYLPMSLVVNKNKTPFKTRNVYDASARYNGTSLNENLLMGPNLLVDMLNPLMRMRMFKYAFTGDVKSMFHRVMICERDQQCQRILWRKSPDEPMRIYIMQVMLFGPAPSPFGSQFVKNKTADKWIDKYPDAVTALKGFTYMDDLLTSEPTAAKAIETATQCIEILKSINWHLVGFQSNSSEVLNALSKENIKQEAIDIMTSVESSYTTKVLGVSWNPKLDVYTFQLDKNAFIKLVTECGLKPTKRDQCSTVARIFDIIGLISHCTIRGRILLQRSWRKGVDWDEEISDEDHKDWLKLLNDLEKVSQLKIPRLRFFEHNMTDATSLELHTFADAGKEAIAAVSYWVGTINGQRYVSFIMSRAKVAPIRIKTKTEISEMPRLEMLAGLIAARLTHSIKILHAGFSFTTYLWSDSEILLNWVKNDNIKLPKFAISPVEEILELTDKEQWNFVDSKNNPADLATKFRKFNFAEVENEWYQGPRFLKLQAEHWPEQKTKLTRTICHTVGYVNQEMVVMNSLIRLPPVDCPLASNLILDMLSPRITSRWSKMVRAVGRALKFYYNAIIPLFKHRQWNNKEARELVKANQDFVNLTPLEIETAELFIIRKMQREVYPREYERLKKNQRINNLELLQLNIFMDHNGIMRISSRVNLPNASYAQKFAPLVPKKSMFSTALLFEYHYKFKHVGLETQIAEFRSKYWMPQLRAGLKKVQSLCNYCGYRRAQPVEYKMAPLPNIRTDTNLKPFEVTGLDCAGPYIIYAKNGHQKKVWILIFTCTVTRFVNLHVLDNLTSLAVFEAIMVLWANHGPVKQFISDHGTNFVGTANVIQSDAHKLIQFLRAANRDIESKLAERSYTSWTFIPVQSPWFGAFYERLIQTVKRSIASSIEGKKISRIEFNIALQEAAHRINCRPLTHNSISTEDEEVLTPYHLAKYRSGWPLLPSIHGMKSLPDPLGDKDHYRRGRLLAEEMMRRFVSQYLPVLTKRTKWFKDFEPIRTGDLVLVIDPNATRKAWERARVQRVYLSRDNNVRVADLLFPDGSIKKNRSVKRLAKLDIKRI